MTLKRFFLLFSSVLALIFLIELVPLTALFHSRGFSEYSFYPWGPFYGFTPSAQYEFIFPPDHDDYDGNYFFPGNSFYYDTLSNYPAGDMTGNIDDDGLFVY